MARLRPNKSRRTILPGSGPAWRETSCAISQAAQKVRQLQVETHKWLPSLLVSSTLPFSWGDRGSANNRGESSPRIRCCFRNDMCSWQAALSLRRRSNRGLGTLQIQVLAPAHSKELQEIREFALTGSGYEPVSIKSHLGQASIFNSACCNSLRCSPHRRRRLRC